MKLGENDEKEKSSEYRLNWVKIVNFYYWLIFWPVSFFSYKSLFFTKGRFLKGIKTEFNPDEPHFQSTRFSSLSVETDVKQSLQAQKSTINKSKSKILGFVKLHNFQSKSFFRQ